MALNSSALPGRKDVTGGTGSHRDRSSGAQPLLGGFSALAESAWMGVAQATEVLEPVHLAAARARQSLTRERLSGASVRTAARHFMTGQLSIAQATTMLMASFFLSALLGAVRQVLFNIQFGAGADANAFYAAIRLPDVLFSLIAGGALSNAMIPVLLSTSREDGDEAGARLINLVLTVLLAVFAIVVFIGELVTPAFVSGVLAPGFDPSTSDLTVALTRIMLIQPVILVIGSVATALLNSRNQFFLTALSIVSHNLALIAGIVASIINPAFGIYGPTYGVVAGAILQVLILLPGLIGRHFKYRPAWNLSNQRLREVIRLLIPNGLAVGVGYAGFILDTAFVSKTLNEAGLPALHNAWMLVGLPIALLGQAVGYAAFPRLAAHAAAFEWTQLRKTLVRSLGAVVALAVPALLVLIFLGRFAIKVLFEHGKYDATAGTLTYQVLVAYAIALPAYVGSEVIVRGLIALRDTRTPLITNTLQLAARAGIILVLISTMGVLSIPVAFAVAASLETVALGAILAGKMQRRLSTEPVPVPQAEGSL